MQRIARLTATVIEDFARDQCLSYAAAISYWALFSIFPLLLVLMAALGAFVHNPSDRERAVDAVFNLLGQSITRDTIQTQVTALAHSGGKVGAIGLVLALWSATSVFAAVRAGIAAVWGRQTAPPFVRGKLIDLAMVLTIGALVVLSILATAVLTAIEGFSTELFGASIGVTTRTLIGLGGLLVPCTLAFVAFALAYLSVPGDGSVPGGGSVPGDSLRLTDVWQGALVGAILFEPLQIGFGIYLSHFANYSPVYGSLGAVIALLTFMYLSAAILLLGAEVTKAAVRAKRGSLTPSPGSA